MTNSRQPNFLLIITDQHRADHLGCYGNPVVRTPHIDGLSEAGIRFDRFYVSSPVCMPNRGTLMTGRIPSANGARMNGTPLPIECNTFVGLLRDSGYRTALIGKSHLQCIAPIPTQRESILALAPGLPPSEPSVEARLIPRSGPDYEVELASRWAEDPDREVPKPYYGFDHVEFCNGHGDRMSGHYINWAKKRDPNYLDFAGPENALPYEGYEFGQAWRTSLPEELHSTSFVRDRTVAYLEEHAANNGGEPFFIQCSFPDPHHPFTPPGKYWGMYDPDACTAPASADADLVDPPPLGDRLRSERSAEVRAKYPWAAYAADEDEIRESLALTYGMISMVDDAVGEILSHLERLGMADNTVVIFTSDHGDLMGEHNLMIKHCFHNEGVLRVPFIWADPEGDSGAGSDQLGGTIDIAATVLGRAGLAPYNGNQGFDLFAGTEIPRTGIYIEEDEIEVNANSGGYTRTRSVVTGRWRLTLWLEDGFGELYDREADPHEITNLWNDPAAASHKANLIEMMLLERLRLDDLSPLPEFVA